jgi:hypothetical protein
MAMGGWVHVVALNILTQIAFASLHEHMLSLKDSNQGAQCVDDPSWMFKKPRQGCGWTQGRSWRCKQSEGNTTGGRTANDACPVSCGTCDTASPQPFNMLSKLDVLSNHGNSYLQRQLLAAYGRIRQLEHHHALLPSYKDQALCAPTKKGTGPRVALAFYGLIRSAATFDSIRKHIYKPLQDASIEFDVFAHSMFLQKLTNNRSKESGEKLNPYNVVLLDPCVFEEEAQFEVREKLFQKYQGMKKAESPHQGFIFNEKTSGQASVQNLLCALHSQERVAALISDYSKQHNFEYDSVALLRPDVAYPIDINITQIRDLGATDKNVYTDTWMSWGGVSDRYMFGGSHIMLNTIMTRIWLWAQRNEGGEKFLKHLLHKEKIQRHETSMPVLRVRANGIVQGIDVHLMRGGGNGTKANQKMHLYKDIYNRCIGPHNRYNQSC